MVTLYRSSLLADFSERGLIHEVSAGLDEKYRLQFGVPRTAGVLEN